MISQLKSSGYSIREIAKSLNRNPSIILKELRRNSYKIGINYSVTLYSAATAQNRYESRKERCGRRNINDRGVIEYIKDKVENYWSTEQISNRETLDIDKPTICMIYRMIKERKLG